MIEVGNLNEEDVVTFTPSALQFTVLKKGGEVGKRQECIVLGRFANEQLLDIAGQAPVPPYIHHYEGPKERYQTIYARMRGSAAAPTAGLHFTRRLLGNLQVYRHDLVFVTLHVGVDTFMPILEEDVENHKMYSESYTVTPTVYDIITQAKEEGRKIIAVGTTSVRVLESMTGPGTRRTGIYIKPGYEFKMVDHLITNFHYPKSTNLVLVSAFAGLDLVEKSYEYAIKEKYRFYSFGDACLIL